MNYQDIFTEKRKGVFKQVNLPVFGSQDTGITPDGVMDQFAFDCGNAILGNPKNSPSLEIIISPAFSIKENIFFTITGAPFKNPLLTAYGRNNQLKQGTVYFAPAGAELIPGTKSSGLRSYLCYKKTDSDTGDPSIIGRSLDTIGKLHSWVDLEGYKRVIEGPEYQYLVNPNDFFNTEWTVGLDISEMGMKLESHNKLKIELDMISEAVTTGTIQITPNGPIVLLKHRQTIGGYPRAFSVISSDVDLLSQYMPHQKIKFKKVSLEEAWQIARSKKAAINLIKEKYFPIPG